MSETIAQSENRNFDLIVVSAFGRGQWLATELAGQGWKTALVDVSKQVGNFSHEDIEGPFGLFESHDLLPSQRARLADEGEFAQAPSGFALWLKEGPLEFRSELTPFLVRARGIPESVENYVRHAGAKPKESERERKSIQKLHYSHSWLAQFAHAFASSTQHENYVALESEAVTPLFSPFGLRQLTNAGIAKGHQVAQTAGVVIRSKARIKDIRFDGKVADAIEIEGDSSGVERARAFVWCLSYEETRQISAQVANQLFPKPWPEPQWTWQRLAFSAAGAVELLESLPISTVVIDDVDLAWTRANMILLRRQTGVAVIDAWVKIPTWMRRETEAFDNVKAEVRTALESRLSGISLTSVGELLSPMLWPVNTIEDAKRLSALKSPNMFFDAPGFWKSLDWLGRFKLESEIIEKLTKLKNVWDAAARKAEAARELQAQIGAQP